MINKDKIVLQIVIQIVYDRATLYFFLKKIALGQLLIVGSSHEMKLSLSWIAISRWLFLFISW